MWPRPCGRLVPSLPPWGFEALTAAPVQRPGASPLERLIVTRPASEASVWVEALRAQGWPAQALPLIEITEPHDPAQLATLAHWRAHWFEADAIMFVSAAAVGHFWSPAMPVRAPDAVHTRFWAPGPGTARVLAQALAPLGLGAAQIDAPPVDAAQFDSEALWPVVAPQLRAGSFVLIVRGASSDAPVEPGAAALAGNGRDWLIRRCEAAGARVEACVAYERHAPVWDRAQRAQVDAAGATGSVWLFSSSEALAHLQAVAPEHDWTGATALVTHPRIAAAARAAGFGRVTETRPALPDVLRTLESNWSRP